MATRKFKITPVAPTFLLDSTDLGAGLGSLSPNSLPRDLN